MLDNIRHNGLPRTSLTMVSLLTNAMGSILMLCTKLPYYILFIVCFINNIVDSLLFSTTTTFNSAGHGHTFTELHKFTLLNCSIESACSLISVHWCHLRYCYNPNVQTGKVLPLYPSHVSLGF